MKVNYYHCFFKKPNSRVSSTRHILDTHIFLNNFIEVSPELIDKTYLTPEDEEYAYIMKTSKPNVFRFICTRDKDIIKAITEGGECLDIQDRLETGDKVGFAAYLYIFRDVLLFGSTLRGPKVGTFANFMYVILHKLSIDDQIRFKIQPIENLTTREQLERFDYIGSSFFEFNEPNTLRSRFSGLFGIDPSNSVGSIQVKVSPSKGENMKDTTLDLLDRIDDNELSRALIRGKKTLASEIMDYYLAGKSSLAEIIRSKKEREIISSMASFGRLSNEAVSLLNSLKEGYNYDTGTQNENYYLFFQPDTWDTLLAGR